MTLSDLLTRRGIRFRVSGGKIHINCPFCTSRGKPEDTKQRLAIHTKLGWTRCMHCDWSHRYGVKPLLKQLGIVAEITGVKVQEDVKHQEIIRLPEDFQLLTHVSDDLDKQARKYVLNRGITSEQIEAHQIGVSYVGRFAYRIIFPIYQEHTLVGVNGRDFTGRQKPKYLLTEHIVKPLYNFNPRSETVVFSEGVIKALRIAQVVNKHFNSVSVLGHDLTDLQLEQIQSSQCQHVIIYPDLDIVGRRGALHIADKLSELWHGKVSFVWPVPGAADDVPLPELASVLTGNIIKYSGVTRCKILL